MNAKLGKNPFWSEKNFVNLHSCFRPASLWDRNTYFNRSVEANENFYEPGY